MTEAQYQAEYADLTSGGQMDSDELYAAYGEEGEDELDVAAREVAEVLAYYQINPVR